MESAENRRAAGWSTCYSWRVNLLAAVAAIGLTELFPLALVRSALLFGVLIAATDPVSVIATFREIGLHGRLRLLVEAESLLNDGVAAVLFTIALAIATQIAPVTCWVCHFEPLYCDFGRHSHWRACCWCGTLLDILADKMTTLVETTFDGSCSVRLFGSTAPRGYRGWWRR